MRSPISGQMNHFEAPSHLHQGESAFENVYAQLKIGHRQDKTSPAEASLPKNSTPPFDPLFVPLVSLPRAHCTACSLAVLPESWGFMTSGSSGGVEKGSILSCSNESSLRRKANPTVAGA